MKKFLLLVALLGVSMASIGCGGDTAKKAPEPVTPATPDPAADPAKAP